MSRMNDMPYARHQEIWSRASRPMPELSRFPGIIILMYYREHNPPHVHAKYGEHVGIFSIADLKLIEGQSPRRVIS